MEIPTFREDTCQRRVDLFKSMVATKDTLTDGQRTALRDDMTAFVNSLEPTNFMLTGAALGLGAAILPVIGAVTGPIIGGAFGAMHAKKLGPYRDQARDLLRDLER